MKVNDHIVLDIRNNHMFQLVEAKQGDHGTRFVTVTLMDGEKVYTPPGGTEARFRCVKPDGCSCDNPAVICEDGTILLELTEQVLAVPGLVQGDVVLTNPEGKILSTSEFTIQVRKTPLGKQMLSENEILAYSNLMAEGKALLSEGRSLCDQMESALGGSGGSQSGGYTLTEADKAEIAVMVIESLGGNPLFGYVDENNNIIVSGNLPDGAYSVKYEMADGSAVTIGDLVLDTNVYYSVTKNLTQCDISNSATKAVAGESYSATITAKDGYELKSVSVTMGGQSVSVSGGNISIANVTGNIVITAVAEEIKAAEPTNFAEYNATNTTDWSIWINNARAGSDGAYRSDSYTDGYGTPAVSNYIAVQNGDVVEFTGIYTKGKNSMVYGSTKNVLKTATLGSQTTHLSDITFSNNEWDGQFTVNNSNVAFMRIGGYVGSNNHPVSEISIKIKRNGEYL